MIEGDEPASEPGRSINLSFRIKTIRTTFNIVNHTTNFQMCDYYFQITPSGVYDVIYLFFPTTAPLNIRIMWHKTDENTKTM